MSPHLARSAERLPARPHHAAASDRTQLHERRGPARDRCRPASRLHGGFAPTDADLSSLGDREGGRDRLYSYATAVRRPRSALAQAFEIRADVIHLLIAE